MVGSTLVLMLVGDCKVQNLPVCVLLFLWRNPQPHPPGTDGLWDNCYLSEIISMAPKSADEAQAAADLMASAARRHASDPDFPSPYAREALAQGWVGLGVVVGVGMGAPWGCMAGRS